MVEKLVSSIDSVYIHQQSKDAPVTSRILKLFPTSKIQWVEDDSALTNKDKPLSSQEYSDSKKKLYITPFKGQFFKRCPGASQRKALTCCNYYVLNLGLQCNMNCSYCYLQSYLTTPVMTIFSNIDDALAELNEISLEHGSKHIRVGTGEVIDSLSLDPITHYSHSLIKFFSQQTHWKLEFKTKSHHVDQFLDCDHRGNVIVSWSINPQAVIEKEEHGTASLEERLQAAEKCARRGFPIAFHMDPMIYHENWKANYEDLIQELSSRFRHVDVQGISVGTLRFQPEQRHMMRERFGMKSWVTQAEVFLSDSGKLRYDSKLRTNMFKFAVDRFKHHSPWPVTICMETPETWIATYEKLPTQMAELKSLFQPVRL